MATEGHVKPESDQRPEHEAVDHADAHDRDELAEQELEAGDSGTGDVVDGAAFLLAHDAHGDQEWRTHHQDHHHERGRNHGDAAQLGVVEVAGLQSHRLGDLACEGRVGAPLRRGITLAQVVVGLGVDGLDVAADGARGLGERAVDLDGDLGGLAALQLALEAWADPDEQACLVG